MHWNPDPIGLVLGLLLALAGIAGLFDAYGRTASSLAGRAARSADLLTFFATTVLGLALGIDGSPRWVHLAALCVSIACMISAVVIRRGAARGAT